MIIQMMTLLHKILTVVILLMIFIVHDHYAYLTQKESAHVGLDFPLPDIVRVFQEQPLFNLSAAVQQNDMLLHHQLVENFCVTFLFSLYGHRCTWREYYLLLDHLRAPFSTLYDPGMGPGFQFDVEVESETETGSGPGLGFESRSLHPPSVRNDRSARGCDEFIYPIHNNSNNNLTDSSLSSTSVMMTAARFHEYVRANQPFVIRNFAAVGATVGATAGAVAGIADMGGGRSDAWPLVHDGSAAATSKKIKRRTATATATTTSNRINVDAAGADAGAWDLSYLKRSMKSSQVVVSATPFGEFDGPEPLSAWGVETTTTTKTTKQKRAIATGTRTAVTTEAAAAAEAAEDSVLIARPAHIQLPFSEFTELLTAPRFQHSREHVALYLEYFPLYAMGEKVVNTTEEPLLVGKLDSQNKKNRKSGKNKSNKKENNGKKRKDKRVRDKSKRDERKTDSDISSSKHMKTNKDSKDSKDKKKKRNTRADRRMASSTSNSSGSLAPPLIYKTTTRHSALQLQVPPIPFAHWLSTDFQLLWMGSGSEYDHSNQTSSSMITSDADVVDVDMDVDIVDIDSMAISKSKVHTSANNNDNIGADTGISFPMTKKLQRNPIGKLHFDRQENLMMMVTGSKTFTLFDPAQSTYLYADIPIRQGNLQVDFNRATGTAVFKREAKAPYYSNEKLSVHAYSPLDIHAEWENLNKKKKQNQQQQGGGGVQSKWPLFQHAVAMKCTVNKGDLLYVPSHWWHEVESFNNQGDIITTTTTTTATATAAKKSKKYKGASSSSSVVGATAETQTQTQAETQAETETENVRSTAGYSIGINWFFEPYYHRRGYQARVNIFQKNRYYAHIAAQDDQNTQVAEDKDVSDVITSSSYSTSSSSSLSLSKLENKVRSYRAGGATLCDSEYVCFRNLQKNNNIISKNNSKRKKDRGKNKRKSAS